MFTSIRTSLENKETVTKLTRQLNLGAENVIARIAFAYSLAQGKQLNLSDIEDAKGKEYSKNVLFGEYFDIYLAMICVHYNIYRTDKDIARYFKMHIDDGLHLLAKELKKAKNITGNEFLMQKIQGGLVEIG